MEKECSFYYTHAFYYLFTITNASHSFPFCKIILAQKIAIKKKKKRTKNILLFSRLNSSFQKPKLHE